MPWQYFRTHLRGSHTTLVCRGRADENHWSRQMKLNRLIIEQIRFIQQNLNEKFKAMGNISQIRSSISSDTGVHPDPFALHRQTFSLNLLCHMQICIASGVFLVDSLTNLHCTVLFNCVQAYSNTTNAFSFPVNGISIPEKKSIVFWVVST